MMNTNLTFNLSTLLRLTAFILCFAWLFSGNLEARVHVIDDFEASDPISANWWQFDNVELSVVPNNNAEFAYLGEQSLRLKGYSKQWYIGGTGRYVGIDLSPFNAIKLIVRGKGKGSGILQLELFDDDNQNWTAEPFETDASQVEFDDKFIYTLTVDWIGWRVIIIPFHFFVDQNADIGDDTFNPYQIGTSGGLTQMQLILLANDPEIEPDIRIDTMKFFFKKKETTPPPSYEDDGW